MAKSKTEKKSPRLVKRGDVVRVPLPNGDGTEVEEVVRDVSLILHLANGNDVRVPISEDLTVVIEPDLTVASTDG